MIIIASILLFINSSYSPIRDLAYLNYDSTIFYLIGKGIKYGLTPYKDLVDHKGIYIFLANYLGALISEHNHIGIFIIQLLISYFNIIVVYKIASLFTDDRRVSCLSALSIFIIQNNYYFCYGAMKCEGFLSPFIYLSAYLLLKYVISGEKEYKKEYIFINGICASIVLFTKPNLLIYFLLIIIILIIKAKSNFALLFKYFIYGALGLIVGSAPAIIYCLANNCLNEMIYYNFNINFIYSGELYFKYDTFMDAIIGTFYEYKEIIVLSILSIIIAFRTKKDIAIYYMQFVILSILTLFVALRPYSYYANTLVINLLPIFICVYEFVFNKFLKKEVIRRVALCFLLVVFTIVSYLTSWLATERHNYHQYVVTKEMAKMVRDEEEFGSDKSTLVVGAVLSIYNELNIFPSNKYIATPYISRDLFSAPYDEILDSINKKESAWVVLSFTPLMLRGSFNEEVRAALKENYKLVGSQIYSAEIYHRIDSNN